ncbi:MAG: polyphosphate kinase 2 family protein, partial [Burkholderiales bacterium]|nr:polyphosphate kinase 2 family protein [Burkholderiales bacterium]
MNFARLRVEPGSSSNLSARDPAARNGAPASKEERLVRLAELAQRVDVLQDLLYAEHRHALLIVLQGMDTAGKDGTIRHVFSEVDPLGVRAVSFRAPAGEELEHGYLWRIHRQVPGRGEIVIFNRSHYEDVLVVRVHDLAPKAVWKERYGHIRDFEELLAEH